MPATPKPAAKPRAAAKPKEPKGVHAKLEAIVDEVGYVEKTGEVSFGKTQYDYMQEHGLLALLKPLWHKYGVTFVVGLTQRPTGINVVVSDRLTTVVVQAVLTDVETGEQIVAEYVGQGQDQTDKASNKALTGANKYALQKFFQVPTEQIDDSDQTVPEGQQATATTKPPKPKAGEEPRMSATQIKKLREVAGDAVRQKMLTADRVIAALQGSYGKTEIKDLTPKEGKAFSEWLTEQIELSAEAAHEDGLEAAANPDAQ
ncbi:MAG TPA: ERF family protein [Solirubrobacterales bacterium]